MSTKIIFKAFESRALRDYASGSLNSGEVYSKTRAYHGLESGDVASHYTSGSAASSHSRFDTWMTEFGDYAQHHPFAHVLWDAAADTASVEMKFFNSSAGQDTLGVVNAFNAGNQSGVNLHVASNPYLVHGGYSKADYVAYMLGKEMGYVDALLPGSDEAVLQLRSQAALARVGGLFGRSEAEKAVVDPVELNFSQSSVSRFKLRIDPVTGRKVTYSFDEIVQGMTEHGWQGKPVNVVKMPDGSLTTIDNTRVLAARQAGIEAHVKIYSYDAPIPRHAAIEYTAKGKSVPTTWGEAIHSRISAQEHKYFQDRIFAEMFRNGSIYDPLITGRGFR